MVLWWHGAVRAGGLLLSAPIGIWLLAWHWDLDTPMTMRPVIFIAAVSAAWARIDGARLGRNATEWVWARASAWIVAATMIIAAVREWPVFAIVLVALVAGAGVAVPAWASVGGALRPVPAGRPPVSRAAMTSATVGGVSALLIVPIAVLAWQSTIEWSGCFLACREPNRVAALGLAAAAGVLLLDVIAWGFAAWRRFPRLLTGMAVVPLLACTAVACLLT